MSTNSEKTEKKDAFVGLNITSGGKKMIGIIAEFLAGKRNIKEVSDSEAVRWCLSIGANIAETMINAESEGKKIEIMELHASQLFAPLMEAKTSE